MDGKNTAEAIGLLIEASDTPEDRAQVFDYLRSAYPEQLGPVATSGSAKLEADPEAPFNLEISIFDLLTPEQQERARQVTTTLAEKYGREESDFAVVRSADEEGKETFAVTLVATEGIDLGDPQKTYDPARSWDKIMDSRDDPRPRFIIVLADGTQVDTRQAVNSDLLKAVAEANPEINEWVWRTGELEKAVRRDAPYAGLYGGRVYLYRGRRSYDYWYFRFRPAVVI